MAKSYNYKSSSDKYLEGDDMPDCDDYEDRDDIYFEEHKDEMGSGRYNGEIIRYLIYIAIMIFGLCMAALCPLVGIIFILIAMKIKEG